MPRRHLSKTQVPSEPRRTIVCRTYKITYPPSECQKATPCVSLRYGAALDDPVLMCTKHADELDESLSQNGQQATTIRGALLLPFLTGLPTCNFCCQRWDSPTFDLDDGTMTTLSQFSRTEGPSPEEVAEEPYAWCCARYDCREWLETYLSACKNGYTISRPTTDVTLDATNHFYERTDGEDGMVWTRTVPSVPAQVHGALF